MDGRSAINSSSHQGNHLSWLDRTYWDAGMETAGLAGGGGCKTHHKSHHRAGSDVKNDASDSQTPDFTGLKRKIQQLSARRTVRCGESVCRETVATHWRFWLAVGSAVSRYSELLSCNICRDRPQNLFIQRRFNLPRCVRPPLLLRFGDMLLVTTCWCAAIYCRLPCKSDLRAAPLLPLGALGTQGVCFFPAPCLSLSSMLPAKPHVPVFC